MPKLYTIGKGYFLPGTRPTRDSLGCMLIGRQEEWCLDLVVRKGLLVEVVID
jgi:hypothetical protein